MLKMSVFKSGEWVGKEGKGGVNTVCGEKRIECLR